MQIRCERGVGTKMHIFLVELLPLTIFNLKWTSKVIGPWISCGRNIFPKFYLWLFVVVLMLFLTETSKDKTRKLTL